jgi:hypothetical protein
MLGMLPTSSSSSGGGIDITEMISNSGNLSDATAKIMDSISKSYTKSSTPNVVPSVPADEQIPDVPDGGASVVKPATIPSPPPISLAPIANRAKAVVGKPYDTMNKQFFNYANMYRSPSEVNEPSQNLIGYYGDALLSGSTAAQPIFQSEFDAGDLPGTRYFINTQTKCEDENGQAQDRSILVDNVMESMMDTFNRNERGLMYSFYASLGSMQTSLPEIKKALSPSQKSASSPSSSPQKPSSVNYLTSKPLSKCKYVEVKTSNEPGANAIGGYVEDADYDRVDPLAMTTQPVTQESFATMQEGFGPLMSHFTGTVTKTHSSYANRKQSTTNKVNKAKSAATSKQKNIQQQGNSQESSFRQMGGTELGDIKSEKKTEQDSIKKNLEKDYQEYYNTQKYPMDKLFLIFLEYNNNNKIKPECIYYALLQVKKKPESFPNNYENSDKNCYDNQYPYGYPTIEPGQFIQEVMDYAALNFEEQGKDYFDEVSVSENSPVKSTTKMVDITSKYIPPKMTCRLIADYSNEGGVGELFRQFDGYKPNWKPGSVNANYKLFWDAIENAGYRTHIVNAFMSTDHPQFFNQCPPVKQNQKVLPSNLSGAMSKNYQEPFVPVTTFMKTHNQSQELMFLVCLFIVIVVFCLFVLHS